jgi:hypothetical protein
MVVIINGEIIQDSDPRAKARRRAAAAPATPAAALPNPWARGSPQRQREQRAPGAPPPPPAVVYDETYIPEALRAIDTALGLQGKAVPVPGMGGKRMPLIYVAVIAVAGLAFGRQIGAGLLVVIGMYWHSCAMAPDAGARAMPRATAPPGR